jgi:hypothetical protein
MAEHMTKPALLAQMLAQVAAPPDPAAPDGTKELMRARS